MSKWTDEAKRFNNAMGRQLVVAAKYVPADKYNWSPGGAARTAAQILLECAGGNHMLAAIIRGEKPAQRDPGVTPEALTFGKAKELLEASFAVLDAAIDSVADKDLTGMITLPWGATMPLEGVIFLPGTHMQYHNGQLNYIQTILGDATPHHE